jgi:hypothetical protein
MSFQCPRNIILLLRRSAASDVRGRPECAARQAQAWSAGGDAVSDYAWNDVALDELLGAFNAALAAPPFA